MKIYHYDRETGFFLGEDSAFESPLEPGVFLIPAWSTDIKPPSPADGEIAKFENGEWSLVQIPGPAPEAEIEPCEIVVKDPRSLRQAAYENEADPLFFKAQRGEATMEEWEAKIEEIRLRYPDQE